MQFRRENMATRYDTVTIPGYLGHLIETTPSDGDRLVVQCRDASKVHDGFHEIGEIYDHRYLLFCALLSWHQMTGYKTLLHHDGTSILGYFLAGCELDGEPISYHLPIEMWDLCPAREVERAPEWDGHTSVDVCDRLERFLKARGKWHG